MSLVRIGLLGCGTVGTGVVRILQDHAVAISARLGAKVEVAGIVVRDPSQTRDPAVPTDRFAASAQALIDDPTVSIIVEVMGGYEPARTHVLAAIAAGKHVVTANKALLARHGAEIFEAARGAGVDVSFEASVGGGIPIVRTLREGFAAEELHTLRAIINGTSNFILSAMTTEGRGYEEVLADAQARGYAEADPTMDVGGADAAQKLSILVALGYGAQLSYEDFLVEGIDLVTPLDIHYARTFGYVIKPLAIAARHEDGIEARVHPTLVSSQSMLGAVNGVYNTVMVGAKAAGPSIVTGQGAGMLPTASAVVADVIELARNVLAGGAGGVPHLAFHPGLLAPAPLRSRDAITCPFYLRFSVRDEPGVLATLAGILGERGISISRMVQEVAEGAPGVQVVMLTHAAREGDVQAALGAASQLPFIVAPTRHLRVEELGG